MITIDKLEALEERFQKVDEFSEGSDLLEDIRRKAISILIKISMNLGNGHVASYAVEVPSSVSGSKISVRFCGGAVFVDYQQSGESRSLKVAGGKEACPDGLPYFLVMPVFEGIPLIFDTAISGFPEFRDYSKLCSELRAFDMAVRKKAFDKPEPE